tara:strand:- start:3968 stop:4759 length:792 start_codon:yes stop_codon:yes gene_type:complete
MSGDIPRTRLTAKAPIGQGVLLGMPDGPEALAHGQHQENIEALAELNQANVVEINALKALVDELDIPDDQAQTVKALRRRIEALENEVRKIWDKLRNLDRGGPYVKYWSAPTEADLDDIELPDTEVDEADLGFDEEENNWYKRNSYNNGWEQIGSGAGVLYKEADFATLDALTGLVDGDRGYTEDKDNAYDRRDGAWRVAHQFESSTAPSSIGESNGDRWFNVVSSVPYIYVSGAWESLAWRKADNKLYFNDDTSVRQISELE